MSIERCPWCGADIIPIISNSGLWDFDYDPTWDSEDKGDCPVCHKPIKVTALTHVTYFIKKNSDEIEREQELYEKRMRGDWS
ncbi:MAG: hypothetical protein IJ087_00110 [Eggerthellaceae bacterium]|nr:hypothetical protein [Eggerthellaceae bacterium]